MLNTVYVLYDNKTQGIAGVFTTLDAALAYQEKVSGLSIHEVQVPEEAVRFEEAELTVRTTTGETPQVLRIDSTEHAGEVPVGAREDVYKKVPVSDTTPDKARRVAVVYKALRSVLLGA